MFSLLNFSSIFPGGVSWPHLPLCTDAHGSRWRIHASQNRRWPRGTRARRGSRCATRHTSQLSVSLASVELTVAAPASALAWSSSGESLSESVVSLYRWQPVAPPGREGGKLPPWLDVQKLCNMCVLSLSWNFFVSHDIHCKAVEQRATLIRRQYNLDWGTSYSRPPIDPYLTSPLLQNPGGSGCPALTLTVLCGTTEVHDC